ncbi:hypothetical protein V1514DRAFT_319900 [Lipomyces japonicus]|uniref:uncharacterized protein n=1 Tax=Lipomyces japonicus TaxID=56871 RepID=UPI0034CF2419
MPPKAFVVPYTIKVKAGKRSIVVLLPPSASFKELKQQIVQALNDTSFKNATNNNDGGDGSDDIVIPKPSFDTVNGSDVDRPARQDQKDQDQITVEDVHVGLPIDKANFSKGWKEISDQDGTKAKTIEALGLRDGSVIAYRTGQEKSGFVVEFPNLEDDDA